MSEIAIRIDGLGKQYHIAARGGRHSTLRDRISGAATAPFRRAAKLLRGQATGAAELDEVIWALKDVSFEIREGEVVGIIGRNGAGKSTLLKVLSRITEPTEGFAEIYGRVGSLLEVGTGFHPELTGRENVYLNGAILGMTRSEIDRKFDEIVAFAEVERFIDTPVKFYSTGMRLRLAFAVAAHLEPEILMVDEVLAVGDAAFQKKCLAKVEDVGQHGRTVLFVSHNMPAITRICERTILLDGGRVLDDGPSHRVVGTYLNSGLGTAAAREWPDPASAPGGDVARLRAVRVRADDGRVAEAVDIRRPVAIELEYEVLRPGYVLMPRYVAVNEGGLELFTSIDQDTRWRGHDRPTGRYVSTSWIPGNFLAEGTIFINAYLSTLNPVIKQAVVHDAVAFHVVDSLDGNSARADWGGRMRGVVRPVLEWRTEFTPDGARAPEPAL
ncbi:MAG: ABC transporter ATP-binding protein [Gemmatimonadota bacterium]|nr:MAG: ABC transporter ATP-binding protein [Gemmatimonadota bacterium]